MKKTVKREFSEYSSMWLFALFDLPVETKDNRRQYTRFRKLLLKEGFTMLQFSVYARHCPSEESAEVSRKAVRAAMPSSGQVRVLGVTDHQYGKMEVYFGKKRTKAEEPQPQLMFF